MIHENICVRWRAYRTHGTAFPLKIVCAVEYKVVKVKIRAKTIVITFAATFLVVCLSDESFTAFTAFTFSLHFDYLCTRI